MHYVNHHRAGRVLEERQPVAEAGRPTLVKIRHRRLPLHLELLFRVLLECIVSFHVVPGIEFEHIVILAQKP